MNIYKATTNDIKELIKLRIDFLRIEKGKLSQKDEEAIKVQLEHYFEKHLLLNDFVAIIAEVDQKIVSTAFLLINERPANPMFLSGKTGVILNVLTYPEYQRKGIGFQVMTALINEARMQDVSLIDLNATKDGEMLYEKLGFKDTANKAMRLLL